MSDLKAQGAQILERLKTLQQNSEVGSTLETRVGQKRQDAAEFPAIYAESDPRDDALQIKNTIASDKRPAPIADWEIDNILAKRAQFEVAKEEAWFQNAFDFDTSNPVQLRWAQEVFPAYFNRREEIIDRQAELQKMIAKLKLRGAKTPEELKLAYALATKKIILPTTPLWKLTGQKFGDADITRGMFNPRRNRLTEVSGPYSRREAPMISNILSDDKIPQAWSTGGIGRGYSGGYPQ